MAAPKTQAPKPLRIAVLVKQIPRVEAIGPSPDGRLIRDGVALETTPCCRRAVSKGVELASLTDGSGTVFTLGPPPAESVLREAVAGGADAALVIDGTETEEDVATAVSAWARELEPWAILAPSTAWGRQVAAHVSAALGTGLTGDAIALEVADGRLVAWKPAMGDRLVAAITTVSPLQMVTLRPGTVPPLRSRPARAAVSRLAGSSCGRIRIHERVRDDNPDALSTASDMVGVGMGVPPEEYRALRPLLDLLGAELATTRKVTDQGWLPHSRQVGLTGRIIALCLYIAIGISGKFHQLVGLRNAGTIIAVNADPEALIFEQADIGIVGDWREVVPILVDELPKHYVARPEEGEAAAASGLRINRP